MEGATVYDRVFALLTDHLGVDPALVRPDARLADLDLDSLSIVEMAVILQEETGVNLTEIPAQSTLGDVVALIEAGPLPALR